MVCKANHEMGDTDVVSKEDQELARESDRLRREIRILKEEYPSWSSGFFSPLPLITQ